MKRTTLFTMLILLASSSLPMTQAFAEWFDGEVQKVDLKAQELTVSETDPITEVEEAEVISVVPTTTFTGVKALKDVRVGDEVSVEAKYDEPADSWQAVSVEVSGAGD